MVKGNKYWNNYKPEWEFPLTFQLRNVLGILYWIQKTLKLLVETNRLMAITLVEDNELLDEVVVVGYGTQRCGSVTGAVSSVSNKELFKITNYEYQ